MFLKCGSQFLVTVTRHKSQFYGTIYLLGMFSKVDSKTENKFTVCDMLTWYIFYCNLERGESSSTDVLPNAPASSIHILVMELDNWTNKNNLDMQDLPAFDSFPMKTAPDQK